MPNRYTGGFVTNTEVLPTTSTASGVWSLQEQLMYRKSELWQLDLNTRALFAGGDVTSNDNNTIEKIEIPTTGNSTDFGDFK